jgi:hypothetical protein
MNKGRPPSTIVAPPRVGSMVIFSIRPPERMALGDQRLAGNSFRVRRTDRRYMAKLMPSDSEELERIDAIPHAGNVPKPSRG